MPQRAVLLGLDLGASKVVAVVAVYSALRSEDSAMIAQDRPALPEGHELADDSKARELNEVMPAAGDDAPADVGGREP